MEASWSEFKTFIDTYATPIQWVQVGPRYYVQTSNGNFSLSTSLFISSSPSEEQTDFETNYKDSGNQPARSNVVQVLGKDTLSLSPRGTFFTADHDSTSVHDKVLDATVVLKGGILYSDNAKLGDYISVSIIDKDDVVGAGGTPEDPTILGTYVTQWYVVPGQMNILEDVSISQTLPAGLYVRVEYTSTDSSIDPIVVINFLAYTTG